MNKDETQNMADATAVADSKPWTNPRRKDDPALFGRNEPSVYVELIPSGSRKMPPHEPPQFDYSKYEVNEEIRKSMKNHDPNHLLHDGDKTSAIFASFISDFRFGNG